ncbi:MAG: methionine--tRNA ligase [Candidatus Nomurabacteria bacterium]|jgi:methionyl-tRNA synthetase|nr:methionine--tRNA ligase [Candidatus Nomurabacteria bacterium]
MNEAQPEEIKKEEYITIEEFKKMKAQIGKVLVAEAVPDSDKLIRFELDFGEEKPRQILSAIREWYPEPEQLVGKMMLFVINLAPRTIRGLESQGMLMAVDGTDGTPVFLVPDRDVLPGTTVR